MKSKIHSKKGSPSVFPARLTAWMALASLLIVAPNTAQADVYVSNLENRFPQGIGEIHNIFPGAGSYTARFSTGGGGAYTVNTVTLEFFITSGLFAPNSWTNASVELFQQTGGIPTGTNVSGTLKVGSFAHPTPNPTPTQWPEGSVSPDSYTAFFDFQPIERIALLPQTEYLLRVSMPASSQTAAGLLFSKTPGYRASDDWKMLPPTQFSLDYLKFAVDATPIVIPEPATLMLALLGGFLLMFRAIRNSAVGTD